MPPLPPWLNVSPHDFVLATQAGAQLGHQIASSTIQAWEEQARMRMAAQEAAANRESHAQQVAVENAMNRLAADRLEAYRQSEIANRQKELGLHQQGLQVDQTREDIQQQRADEQVRRNTTLEGIRALAEKRQQEREDRIASTDKFMDIAGVLYRIPANGGEPVPVNEKDKTRAPYRFVGPDGKHYEQYPGEPAKLIQMPGDVVKPESHATRDLLMNNMQNNLNFLRHPLSGMSGSLPPIPVPPQAITNAPPAVGQSFAPQEIQAAPSPVVLPAPTPKKRVKVKGPNGVSGTIEEGDTLPDGWTVAQ